jgi:hypothetical protein
MEGAGVAKIAAFVFASQQRRGISDRMLLERASVSPHTLKALREGKAVEDDVLKRLAAAVEDLRPETAEAKTVAEDWLEVAIGPASSPMNSFSSRLSLSLPIAWIVSAFTRRRRSGPRWS